MQPGNLLFPLMAATRLHMSLSIGECTPFHKDLGALIVDYALNPYLYFAVLEKKEGKKWRHLATKEIMTVPDISKEEPKSKRKVWDRVLHTCFPIRDFNNWNLGPIEEVLGETILLHNLIETGQVTWKGFEEMLSRGSYTEFLKHLRRRKRILRVRVFDFQRCETLVFPLPS